MKRLVQYLCFLTWTRKHPISSPHHITSLQIFMKKLKIIKLEQFFRLASDDQVAYTISVVDTAEAEEEISAPFFNFLYLDIHHTCHIQSSASARHILLLSLSYSSPLLILFFHCYEKSQKLLSAFEQKCCVRVCIRLIFFNCFNIKPLLLHHAKATMQYEPRYYLELCSGHSFNSWI